MTLKYSLGLDVSSLDTKPAVPLNYNTAKQRGIEYVTVRKSAGFILDTMYPTNYAGAIDNGILDIPYHYYHPRKDPIRQADTYLSGNLSGEWFPVLDLEDYGTLYKGYIGIWQAELRPWLMYVEAATGVRPAIYTGQSYINAYLSKEYELNEYPLMMANYLVAYPYMPPPYAPM